MRKKWITVVLCASFMLFGMSISGMANSYLQEIKAYLNGGLKVQLDGKNVEFKDENGKKVLPISYEGTTYLPVRGISELFDINVAYDPENYAVVLGDPPVGQPSPPKEEIKQDGTIELVSWSDRIENDQVIVTSSVKNHDKTGKIAGIVATAYDSKGKAIEVKGTSSFVSSGHVSNFNVKFSGASDIDSIKVDVAGYAESVALRASADRLKDNKIVVTGVLENGTDSGEIIGLVATGYSKDGKAIETKGTSSFVSSGHVSNFTVTLNAEGIDYVEVKRAGSAKQVQLLSEASRLQDGKLIVTTAVENGTDKGLTAGIVVTGYDKNGKAVESKGSSSFISSEHVSNFTVTLTAGSEITSFKVEVTEK